MNSFWYTTKKWIRRAWLVFLINLIRLEAWKKKNESNRYRKYQHISLQPMKCLLAKKSEHGDNPIKRMSENATKHLTIRFNTGQHAKKRYRTHRLISYYGSQGSTSVTNHRDINKIEFMSVTPSRDRKQKQAYPSSTSSRGWFTSPPPPTKVQGPLP